MNPAGRVRPHLVSGGPGTLQADVSTGDLRVRLCARSELGSELARLSAAELVLRAPAEAELAALAETAGDVTVHGLEVTDGVAVAALAESLGGAPVDLLLNNAGVYGPKQQTMADMDYDGWLDTFAANSMAPLRLAAAFAANVAASEHKRMVTITSRMGSIEQNESGAQIAYRSSKSAVNMVMDCVANELRPQGVTCVVFHPGWVRTDMGGPSAALEIDESVSSIRAAIAGLTPADTGRFLNYDGTSLPW